MIKLLNKSDIDTGKAKDRQAEIAEGLKLAKRVDALREVAVEEEASLEKFRHGTLAEIARETEEATIARDIMLAEVKVLEGRKATALVPLDAEIKRIEGLRAVVDELLANVADKEKVLHEVQVKQDGEWLTIAELKREAEVMHTNATALLAEAGTLNGEAERKQALASTTLSDAERISTVKIANAEERERWVTERESAALIKEEALRSREQELDKKETVLKDREATLARNLKRNA